MRFEESEFMIQPDPSIPLVEHFSEDDYEKIKSTLQLLKTKQKELDKQIEERKKSASSINEKYNEYRTFYHMFTNNEERNQSYFKMLLFLITLICILILLIVSYFIYTSQK